MYGDSIILDFIDDCLSNSKKVDIKEDLNGRGSICSNCKACIYCGGGHKINSYQL